MVRIIETSVEELGLLQRANDFYDGKVGDAMAYQIEEFSRLLPITDMTLRNEYAPIGDPTASGIYIHHPWRMVVIITPESLDYALKAANHFETQTKSEYILKKLYMDKPKAEGTSLSSEPPVQPPHTSLFSLFWKTQGIESNR